LLGRAGSQHADACSYDHHGRRRRQFITLAAVALFSTGAALFAAILTADYWALWQGAFCLAGSCVVAHSIFRGEMLSEPVSPAVAPARGRFEHQEPRPALVSRRILPDLVARDRPMLRVPVDREHGFLS
jgi:hypothetical protein